VWYGAWTSTPTSFTRDEVRESYLVHITIGGVLSAHVLDFLPKPTSTYLCNLRECHYFVMNSCNTTGAVRPVHEDTLEDTL